MKLLFASDHGGFALKIKVRDALAARGHAVTDAGIHAETSADYPLVAEEAVRRFFAENQDFGFLFCGTGIGISIAANKMAGIRCALIHDRFTAAMAREHNHANFLAFGGRVQYPEPVEDLIELFLAAAPAADRHARRVAQMDALDRRPSGTNP